MSENTTPTAGQRVAEAWYDKAIIAVDSLDFARLVADIDAAIAQARREGAEAAHEACVDVCNEVYVSQRAAAAAAENRGDYGGAEAADDRAKGAALCAGELRDLPRPGDAS